MKAMTINRIADFDQTANESMSGSRRVLASSRAFVLASDLRLITVVGDLTGYRSSENLGLLGSGNDGFTGRPMALFGGKMV